MIDTNTVQTVVLLRSRDKEQPREMEYHLAVLAYGILPLYFSQNLALEIALLLLREQLTMPNFK